MRSRGFLASAAYLTGRPCSGPSSWQSQSLDVAYVLFLPVHFGRSRKATARSYSESASADWDLLNHGSEWVDSIRLNQFLSGQVTVPSERYHHSFDPVDPMIIQSIHLSLAGSSRPSVAPPDLSCSFRTFSLQIFFLPLLF